MTEGDIHAFDDTLSALVGATMLSLFGTAPLPWSGEVSRRRRVLSTIAQIILLADSSSGRQEVNMPAGEMKTYSLQELKDLFGKLDRDGVRLPWSPPPMLYVRAEANPETVASSLHEAAPPVHGWLVGHQDAGAFDPSVLEERYNLICARAFAGLPNPPSTEGGDTTQASWERIIESLTDTIAKTEGVTRRHRDQSGAVIDSFLGDYSDRFRWRLEDRAEWPDAYHIPEQTTPWLLTQVTVLLAEFGSPVQVQRWVDILLSDPASQLGLFHEGFCALLYQQAEHLVGVGPLAFEGARVARVLRQWVHDAVFERHTRVAYLCRSSVLLAMAGYELEAREGLEQVLKSSSGPSWYKEAQFQLALHALDLAVPENKLGAYQSAYQVLDLASGEATFQKYVEKDKVGLIRHMARAGDTALAAQLIVHYVLPTPAEQLRRIRQIPCDTVEPGVGSRFGVRDVHEAEAATALLPALHQLPPKLKWALVEVFWLCAHNDHEHTVFARTAIDACLADPFDDVIKRLVTFLVRDFSGSELADRLAALERVAPEDLRLLLRQNPLLAGSLSSTPPSPVGPRKESSSSQSPDDSWFDEWTQPGVFGRRSDYRAVEEFLKGCGGG